MAAARSEVVVSAGNLRPVKDVGVVMPHRWTSEGVVVEADSTGAHLYDWSAAGCVLNDLYREARRLAITIDGARVPADGDFDPATWPSTGIDHRIEVTSKASDEEIERLVILVDDVAEIPKALRFATTVTRQRAP